MAASSYHPHPTPFPVDHLLTPDHTMHKLLPPSNYPSLLFPSEDDDQSVFFNDGILYDPLLLGYLYNFQEQLSLSMSESNNVATGASATASSCCLDQSTVQLQHQPNSLIPNSSSVGSSENVEFPRPPSSLAVKQSPGGANRRQIIMGPKRKQRGDVDGSSSNSKDVGGGRGKKKQKKGDRDDVNNNNSNTNEINSTDGSRSTGYIHVRARRGQATDSHSLAERVRREKISKKMKLLQTLVPGCDEVTGKAMMLDEIINYVQSLQSQVEFLSMKLASLDPTSSIYNYGGVAAAAAIGMDHHHHRAFMLGPEGLSRMGSPILPTEMLQQCISSSSPPASSSSQTHQTQTLTSFSFQQQHQEEQQSGPSSSSNVAFCLPQETVAKDPGLFWEAAAGGSQGYSSSGYNNNVVIH